MNKEELSKLMEISDQTEAFLTEYSNGIYGKVGDCIDVNEKVVNEFMEKCSKSDMEEVLSYLQFKNEMISDKGVASDLEDWIDYVINV